MAEIFFSPIDLQMFADGGGTGAWSAGSADGGVTDGAQADGGIASAQGVKGALSEVRYGIQDGAETVASSPNESAASEVKPDARLAEFERMIKGEYKDLYDARVQDTIQKRLKGTKETVERYEQLSPTIDLLTRKYGVKEGDIAALNRAIEEDDSFFEEEAMEKGISVEQLKAIRKMERENADLKRQMQQRQTEEKAERLYAQWMDQSKAVKAVYPSFDLKAELANEQFVNLLRSNVDVRTAYEVIHKDEIIPAAMQFTAQNVERKITNKIRAAAARPQEGGSGSSAPVTKSDVTQLTRADRDEIARRVMRGEKIRF